MPTVAIPPEHFTKSVKADYSDHKAAIFREAIQNSVDAGATLIAIVVNDNSVTIEDDGCGMTPDVLVQALLTMSGSFKSSGSIGGFGQAKSLLLFQHDSYEVHTRSTHVTGSVLDYEMYVDVPERVGTRITMNFREDYGFTQEDMLARAIAFVTDCDTRATITINGSVYNRNRVTRMVKEMDWCKVYCENSEEERNEVVIRINGVKMFSKWVGAIKKNIIVEITKPSTEILTSNRDGFVWTVDNQVGALIQEITVDKSSFGRLHNTVTKYEGNARSFISRIMGSMRELIFAMSRSTSNSAEVVPFTATVNEVEEKVLIGAMTQAEAIATLKVAVENIPAIKKNVENIITANIEADFFVQINDTGYEKIPAEIAPGTMKKKYETLAKAWKAAINHVTSTSYLRINFCIGFVVDSSCEAKIVADGDGRVKLFINPYQFKTLHGKELAFKLIQTAAHELTHLRHKYHDENFCANYDDLLLKSLLTFSPTRFLAEAKKEKI